MVVTPISPFEYIGNSLATINDNFNKLDTNVTYVSGFFAAYKDDFINLAARYYREFYTNSLTAGYLAVTGNTTVYGNLSVLGTSVSLDTLVTTTSALSVTNIGTGPALEVVQIGDQPVAVFFDGVNSLNDVVPALIIDGATARAGNVGIGLYSPSQRLTVQGGISASAGLSADAAVFGSRFFPSANVPLPNTVGHFYNKVTGYSQVNNQNFSNDAAASTDFIATSDTGNDTSNYIDLGINSSGYSAPGTFDIVGANDGYLYATNNISIGTCGAKDIRFHTNGTAVANERLRITSTGDICANTSTCAATNVCINTGSGTSTANVAIQTGSSTGNLTLGSSNTTTSKLDGTTVCIGNTSNTATCIFGGTNTYVCGTTNCVNGTTVSVGNTGNTATKLLGATACVDGPTVCIGNASNTATCVLGGTNTCVNGPTVSVGNTGNTATKILGATACVNGTTVCIGNTGNTATYILGGTNTCVCGATTCINGTTTAYVNGATNACFEGATVTVGVLNTSTNVCVGNTSATTKLIGGTTTYVDGTTVCIGNTGNTATCAIGATVKMLGGTSNCVYSAANYICGSTKINENAGSATTNINTGTTSGAVNIGNTNGSGTTVTVAGKLVVPAGSIATTNACAVQGNDVYAALGNASSLAGAASFGTTNTIAPTLGNGGGITTINGNGLTLGTPTVASNTTTLAGKKLTVVIGGSTYYIQLYTA